MFCFANTYVHLPPRFYAQHAPVPVERPALIAWNTALAAELNIENTASAEDLAAILAGNAVPLGAEPLALAYAGHQFGNFVPQLGDGRAILLGEVLDAQGSRRDIQLKGSGRTPFSRQGDGRAALGPVLREYLVSEAMHTLGIPTTRSLAAVATGEPVYRETPLPGAILTRVAASHIRIGTFQYSAARGDEEGIRLLTEYVIARHYPHAAHAANPPLAMLKAIIQQQASLIAQWLNIGFIHGVMNTDNMAVSGETIDYGPCAFMDTYNPQTVFSAIDRHGRYAYTNQPSIAAWNLTRLAETLLPLLSTDQTNALDAAHEALDEFFPIFQAFWHDGMRRKLGLQCSKDDDISLIGDLLALMQAAEADFTVTFRQLSALPETPPAVLGQTPLAQAWFVRWCNRLSQETSLPAERRRLMEQTNPAFIPRNHQVEHALRAAVEQEDYRPFNTLREVLASPYKECSAFANYALPPAAHERVYQTFCGT
jgi:serine/tyrosine/threonine adenylyltransferase